MRQKTKGRDLWRAKIEDPRTGDLRWVSPFKGSGIEHWRRTRKKARELAQEIYEEWLEQAQAAREEDPRDRILISDFLDLAAIQDPGVPRIGNSLSPNTIKKRKDVLEKFGKWLANRRLRFVDEITPLVVDSFLLHRSREGLGASSIVRETANIRRAFNYGIEKQILDMRNPVTQRSRKPSLGERTQSARAEAFSPSEIEAIFRGCKEGYRGPKGTHRMPHPALLPFLRFMNETGLRPVEMRGICWSDIDGRMLSIRKEVSKTGFREIPLSDQALSVLDGLSKAGPLIFGTLTKSTQEQALKKLLDGIGVPRRGAYGFRHAFALRIASSGLGIHKLKVLMGHTSITTTEIYLQTQAAEFADEFLTATKRQKER